MKEEKIICYIMVFFFIIALNLFFLKPVLFKFAEKSDGERVKCVGRFFFLKFMLIDHSATLCI